MADTVRNAVNADRRHKVETFLTNLGKFAVDSAVNVSRKGFTGGKKVYKTMEETLYKNEPNLRKLEDENVKEEKQLAKMEEIVKTEVKQQCKEAGKGEEGSAKGLKPKELDLQIPNKKRIFIRSRL